MSRVVRALVLGLATLVGAAVCSPPTVEAFSIGSGVTRGCHEEISAKAFARFLSEIDTAGRPTVDLSKRWRRLVHLVADAAGQPNLSDTEAFVLTSLIVGVRAPDTDGHSVTNLESLRGVHADPDP